MINRNNQTEAQAIDEVAKYASRTIRFDEDRNTYIVADKITGETLGEYETYREARKAIGTQ